jgi:hypothetical protein
MTGDAGRPVSAIGRRHHARLRDERRRTHERIAVVPSFVQLAAALSEAFTAYTHDRPGKGDSGGTARLDDLAAKMQSPKMNPAAP